MLNRLTIGVHLVDVDAGDSGIPWIIVEEVEEVHVGPDVVADGDDLVYDNASLRAFTGDLSEELSKRHGSIRNQRVVLDVPRSDMFGSAFLGPFRVDHQLVKLE